MKKEYQLKIAKERKQGLDKELSVLENGLEVAAGELTQILSEKSGKFSEEQKIIQKLQEGETRVLLNLIKNENIEGMKKYFDLGYDINAKDKYGWTLLHHAVYLKKSKVVEMLIVNGTDPTIKTHFGERPLDLAVKNKDTKSSDLLTAFKRKYREKRKINPIPISLLVSSRSRSFSNQSRRNAIDPAYAAYICTTLGKPTLAVRDLQILIQSKEDQKVQVEQKLELAKKELDAYSKQLEDSKRLILHREVEEHKVLLSLIEQEDFLTLLHFIKHGYEPNVCDEKGWTLLHHAVFLEKVEAIKILLENKYQKVDLNKVNNLGELALHFAAKKNNKVLINLILKNSDDVYICNARIKDKSGRTALEHLDKSASCYKELETVLKEAMRGAKRVYNKTKADILSELNDLENKAKRIAQAALLLEVMRGAKEVYNKKKADIQSELNGLENKPKGTAQAVTGDPESDQKAYLDEINGFIETLKQQMVDNLKNTILLEDEKAGLLKYIIDICTIVSWSSEEELNEVQRKNSNLAH